MAGCTRIRRTSTRLANAETWSWDSRPSRRACAARPVGYRSPAWDFSERTAQLLCDFGFLYDSSLMGDDFEPYYMRSGDRAPDDAAYVFGRHVNVVELPVSWTLDDFPYFELDDSGGGLKPASQVEEIWREEFAWGPGPTCRAVSSISPCIPRSSGEATG